MKFGARAKETAVDTAPESQTAPRPRSLLTLADRAIGNLADERTAWAILGVAIVFSGALILWFTRSTSFFSDEFTYFATSRGYDLKALLSPHNGHLIAGVRLLYATVFKLFGAHYLVFRLLEAVGVALVAVLFFVFAKRRLGTGVALAPSVLLLFLGSAADDTLSPLGITHVYSVAAGLGALLVLERDDKRGDLAGCALLVVAVCTFSVGLAFLGGGAVSVLLRRDGWRRAWVFLIPLAVFGAWHLAPKLAGPGYDPETHFKLSNIRFVPKFVVQGTAAVAAAITGLSYDFTNPVPAAAGSAPDITTFSRGYPIAALVTLGLFMRLLHGPPRRSLWASLAVLLAFWSSTAMVQSFNRYPYSERFVYAGAVALLLVVVDVLAGVRLPRRLAPLVLVATVFALAVNIDEFRGPSDVLRSYAQQSRADLSAIELARQRIGPGFAPIDRLFFAYFVVGGAGHLLDAVDRNGSFAFSLPELRDQSEAVRDHADSTLARALGLRLTEIPSSEAAERCVRHHRHFAAARHVKLRSPGVLLRSGTTTKVTLGRFADTPAVQMGSLPPGRSALLRLPRDQAPEPWQAALSGLPMVCPLGTR